MTFLCEERFTSQVEQIPETIAVMFCEHKESREEFQVYEKTLWEEKDKKNRKDKREK
jgi:hypothetical protein